MQSEFVVLLLIHYFQSVLLHFLLFVDLKWLKIQVIRTNDYKALIKPHIITPKNSKGNLLSKVLLKAFYVNGPSINEVKTIYLVLTLELQIQVF